MLAVCWEGVSIALQPLLPLGMHPPGPGLSKKLSSSPCFQGSELLSRTSLEISYGEQLFSQTYLFK